MTLCINPRCPKPQNSSNTLFCQACGSEVLLQGRYRADRELGSGGFGKTYEISDQGTPKVLKVLINTSPKAIALFKREAQVLSQLIYPGIPRVEPHGYFTHSVQDSQVPLHCLVMEKVEGENLHTYIKKRGRPIDGEIATRWVIELLLILQQVHNQGILHRDIKPQNIILKPDGKLALIDFGAVSEGSGTEVATAAGSGGGTEVATHASGGTVIWTRGYAPIEQINGEAVPQSDFFALGRTFVFLLTGKEPTDRAIYDAANDELKWHSYASGVSPHLSKLIDQMIARLARQRPMNAQAILQQLDTVNSPINTKQLPSQNSPVKGKDIEVELKITEQEAISGTSKEITFSRTIYPNGTASSSRQETKKLTVKVTPKSQHISRLRLNGQGHEGINGSNPGNVYVRLLITRTNNDQPYLSNQKQSVKGLGQNKKNWTPQIYDAFNGLLRLPTVIAFHPDGQTLAGGSAFGKVKIWDLAKRTSTPELILPQHTKNKVGYGGEPINTIAFSPDGKLLASGACDGDIQLYNHLNQTNYKTINSQKNVGLPLGDINYLKFSSNGQILAVIKGKTIILFNCRTWEWIETPYLGDSLAFTPDSQTLVWTRGDEVYVVNLKDQLLDSKDQLNTNISLDRFRKYNYFRLAKRNYFSSLRLRTAFSVNGQVLAVIEDNGKITLFSWTDRKEQASLVGHTKDSSWVSINPFSLVFSPDGETLISGGPDKKVNFWHIPTQELVYSMSLPGKITAVEVSADGKTVAAGTDNGKIVVFRDS